MKIYYEPQSCQGRVMHNIADKLKKYAPEKYIFVKNYKEADLVIENIYGDHKSVKAVNNDEIIEHLESKPFGVLFHGFAIPKKYVLQNEFFNWCFKKAKFIYTPWDLTSYYGFKLNNFLRGAWGVESEEFYRLIIKKRYIIAATGYVSSTEAIQEIYEACKIIKGKMLHLGHNFGFDNNIYENRSNVSIEEVRLIFNSSNYVSALRRSEGFELPAIESGACGVRPICFNNPHYTDWFKDFAIFIDETTSEGIVSQLVEILSKEPEPISEELRLDIKRRFDWKVICKNIWDFVGRII